MPKATRLNRNLSNQDKLFFTLQRDNPRWKDLKRSRYNSEKMADYVELLNDAYVKKFAANEEVCEGRVLPKHAMRDDEDKPYLKPPPQKNRKKDEERFEQEVSEAFCTFWKSIESSYQTHKEEIHDLMRAPWYVTKTCIGQSYTLIGWHDGMNTDTCVLSELAGHPLLLNMTVFRLLQHK